MINENTKVKIEEKAKDINIASEKYQLIHAMFAIEKLLKDDFQKNVDKELASIRQKANDDNLTEDEKKDLHQQVIDLRKERNKRIKIVVDYIPQIKENSARTIRTVGNTFFISLPESMGNTRNSDGKIDFDKLGRLRKLMAHELGHIVLHSEILNSNGAGRTDDLEEEAEYFAECLIGMRRLRNEEIHSNDNYLKI